MRRIVLLTFAFACVVIIAVAVVPVLTRALASRVPQPMPPSVQSLPLDFSTTFCAGPIEDRLAVLRLEDGQSMWDAFPAHGRSPELEGVNIPLLAVVYRDGWPGGRTGRLGSTEADRQPPPGTLDVCLEAADGSPTLGGAPVILYGSVSDVDAVVVDIR